MKYVHYQRSELKWPRHMTSCQREEYTGTCSVTEYVILSVPYFSLSLPLFNYFSPPHFSPYFFTSKFPSFLLDVVGEKDLRLTRKMFWRKDPFSLISALIH